MSLKDQRNTIVKAAKAIAEKAKTETRELTPEEVTEINAKMAEVKELDVKIANASKSADVIAQLGELGEDTEGDDDPEVKKGGATTSPRAKSIGLGEAFTKSDAYTSFRKENPSGVGQGSPVNIGRVKVGTLEEWRVGRKALTSPQARLQAIRLPTIDLVDRDRLTFLDLISRGETGGNFEYVQVTGVTRNAKIVPEATSGTDNTALKPVSDLTTELADAKVYTYADGYDVTNQLLADAPAFASYLDNELEYSLDNVVEDKLLNGSGTGGEPRGVLNTSGVQQQTYTAAAGAITDAIAKAFIRATRQAITKVTRLPGGTVQAVVLSPEMDEAIDLLQDDNGRYYSNGPFNSGPGTLWGRPRVTSERLTETTSILGDFRQIALLDREGLSVLAFNQHKDYAQRNMTYVRAELRAAQAIWKPNRLVVVKPAA